MIVLGIDPGLNGAIVVMNESQKILYKSVTPIIIDEYDKKFVDVIAISKIIQEYEPNTLVLEKANTVSAFTSGKNWGALWSLFTLTGKKVILVSPRVWASFTHLPESTIEDAKERSLEAVKYYFPDEDFKKSSRCKIQHDGIVDAVLITRWAILNPNGYEKKPKKKSKKKVD
jgi:hypothetical protein